MKHISRFTAEVLRALAQANGSTQRPRANWKNLLFSALLLALYVARIVNDLL